jgi:hypothetical protein
MSEKYHKLSRRGFLKWTGASVPSLIFAPKTLKFLFNGEITNKSTETGGSAVLTKKQRQDLIVASRKYIARETQEATKVAQLIDYRENDEYESPGNMCGPLSIAILRDAGLLSVGVDVSDFWPPDPINRGEIFEQNFPRKMYEWVEIEKPIDKIDYQQNPLQAGDLLFLRAGQFGGFGHILVVNRVDEKGRAYSVNNFNTPSGIIIDEVMLYDPNQPGVGQFYEWTDFKNAKIGLTGFDGYFLWRLKDNNTVLPANRYESLGYEKLHKDIGAIIEKSEGKWRILVQEIDGQTLYVQRPDKILHPASVIKISIAMDLLQWLDKRKDKSLDESLSEVVGERSLKNLLHEMIVNSEENATEILRKYLEGQHSHSIEETLQNWGVWHTTTDIRRSTAEDTTILLRGLYQGSLLSPAARDKLLNYMAEYTKSDDLRIGVLRSVLPSDCHIYNKRGTIIEDILVIADAAIVEVPDREKPGMKKSYTMVFYGYKGTKSGDDAYEKLENAIGEMAQRFYEFTQTGE